MPAKQATCKYALGNGLFLHAFALDPGLTDDDLTDLISSKDGTAQEHVLESLYVDLSLRAAIPSLQGFEVRASDDVYAVPEQLQPYRDALESVLLEKRMFDGGIMVVKGGVEVPLNVYRGGFFDFKATELSAVPAETLGTYPAGKTVDELLPGYGLDMSHTARYLGLTFIMRTKDGEELSFVHRATGLGIAADCMAFAGATPPFHEDFLGEDFDFAGYFRRFIEKEIGEEYKLAPEEFKIGRCDLVDDKKSVPTLAIEITTPLSTRDIAARAHGDEGAIKEHPILYSTDVDAVPVLIERFPLLPSTAYLMQDL